MTNSELYREELLAELQKLEEDQQSFWTEYKDQRIKQLRKRLNLEGEN